MPSWGALKQMSGNPFSYGNAPGILMDVTDHMATASWGPAGAAYRAEQAAALNEGRFLDVLARDIQDVRDVATRAGNPSKYDPQIQEMLNYLWGGKW